MVFTEMDHRLSVVKRWGILHTIQTQSVAEHCFNVQRIAHLIAVEWLDITDPGSLLAVLLYAHHHDDEEAISGDIPSNVKPYFDENSFKRKIGERMAVKGEVPDVLKAIIKIADMLEAYHFLCTEIKLGNKFVERHLIEYEVRLEEYAHTKFCKKHGEMLWTNIQQTMDYMKKYNSEDLLSG